MPRGSKKKKRGSVSDGGPSLFLQCYLLQKPHLPLFIMCSIKWDYFLLLGEVLYFPAPLPECLSHLTHLIKNYLKSKGQLKYHLPHEPSWVSTISGLESLQGVFSAFVLHLLPGISSKCAPFSPLLRAGSTEFWILFVIVYLGPPRTLPWTQQDALKILTGLEITRVSSVMLTCYFI